MNHVSILGNLTRDPELRYMPNGNAVVNFTIANNRKWKDGNGELKEEVSFIGIVAFGKQAETIGQHFKKGSPILIEGRLKQESWEDKKSGEKKSKTLVLMEKFYFMGGKVGAGADAETSPASEAPAVKPPKTIEQQYAEDDVPF